MNDEGRLLADVVAETLEQFAFLFVEPEEGTAVPAQPADYIQATIGFSGGGEQGTVTIAAPVVLCREMAGNILGQDNGEIEADVAADAIKELSNILAGSWTARRLGVGTQCALSPPVARMLGPDQIRELLARPGALCFRVDEHLVVAALEEKLAGV